MIKTLQRRILAGMLPLREVRFPMRVGFFRKKVTTKRSAPTAPSGPGTETLCLSRSRHA